MKCYLLATASVAAVCLASQASAADLRVVRKAAPQVLAPVWTWTGFYIGAQVGLSAAHLGGGAHTEPLDPDEGDPAAFHPATDGDFTQVLAGGHVGYNYQLNS